MISSYIDFHFSRRKKKNFVSGVKSDELKRGSSRSINKFLRVSECVNSSTLGCSIFQKLVTVKIH